MIKKKIFCVFSERLLALNQLFKKISSSFNILIRAFKSLPLTNTHASSAYNILKADDRHYRYH